MNEWEALDCVPDAADAIDLILHAYGVALIVSRYAPVSMTDAMNGVLGFAKRIIENGGKDE